MMFLRKTLTLRNTTSIQFYTFRYLTGGSFVNRKYTSGIGPDLNNIDVNFKVSNHRRQQHSEIIRSYHVSAVTKKNPTTIILSLSAMAATAKAGQYIIRAYEQWKLSQPEKPPIASEPDTSSTKDENMTNDENKTGGSSTKSKEEEGKRENIFQTLFNIGVGSKFYEGGFEEKMTRREAALILGVRETSTTKRIKEAHRKLLVLNHPDTGGSTYLAGKINEAKELLMKGRREQ